jgi:hypothetical protein
MKHIKQYEKFFWNRHLDQENNDNLRHKRSLKLANSNNSFSKEEMDELTKLGFAQDGNDIIYNKSKSLVLKVFKKSISFKGVVDTFYTLYINYNPSFQHIIKNPEHFKDFQMNLLDSKSETYDTFKELIDHIKTYIK